MIGKFPGRNHNSGLLAAELRAWWHFVTHGEATPMLITQPSVRVSLCTLLLSVVKTVLTLGSEWVNET